MRFIFSAILFAATLFPEQSGAIAQDPERGEKLFRRCAACHTATEDGADKIGPNLFGVIGRDIATKDGFRYSKALLALEGSWTEDALNQYLLSPRTYARGTKMAFAGLRKTQDRTDVIAWLKVQVEMSEPDDGAQAGNPAEDSVANADLALLPDGGGKQETYDSCASCHSIKLVVQQGMDKDQWLETIEWMVDEQGMDALEDDLNQTISEYLATHFGRDRPNFPK